MYVWADNTGLHNAFRTIKRRSHGDDDILGFLQLGSLIVFSESIVVNSLEPQDIVQTTSELISMVRSHGLESTEFFQAQQDLEAYKAACLDAAESAAQQIEAFPPSVSSEYALHPQMSDIDVREIIDDLHTTIVSPPTAAERAEQADSRIESGAAGAIHYMLGKSESLWQEVERLRHYYPEWTYGHTISLNGLLRFYLNGALGSRLGKFEVGKKTLDPEYCPAVGRARLLRHNRRYLLARLIQSVDRRLHDYFEEVSLPVPFIIDGIIKRGRFEPEGILEEAVALRHRARRTRKWLTKLLYQQQTTSEKRLEVENQIREAGRAVADAVAGNSPSALDMFSLSVAIPPAQVALDKLRLFLQHKRLLRKTTILTSLSRDSISSIDDRAFARLRRNCSAQH